MGLICTTRQNIKVAGDKITLEATELLRHIFQKIKNVLISNDIFLVELRKILSLQNKNSF